MVRRKNLQGPCNSCGDEGAEVCWLCHYFLCAECLEIDYEHHREEARRWGGRELSLL